MNFLRTITALFFVFVSISSFAQYEIRFESSFHAKVTSVVAGFRFGAEEQYYIDGKIGLIDNSERSFMYFSDDTSPFAEITVNRELLSMESRHSFSLGIGLRSSEERPVYFDSGIAYLNMPVTYGFDLVPDQLDVRFRQNLLFGAGYPLRVIYTIGMGYKF